MRLALAALALVLAAPLASAQDTSQSPSYGTIELDAGFSPDPAEISVVAGGDTSVEVSGCNGMVAESPDVNLVWGGGSTLYIFSVSDSDTTLLVNLPDGDWMCDDDTIGTNPLIIISDAPAGTYNIWAGAFGDGGPAEVMISEMDPR